MATDAFLKRRLASIGEQFSQCEPVELVMIREVKPVSDAARKAALADIIDDIADEQKRLGQLHVKQPMLAESVSIEELARRHVCQDRIKAKMLDECRGFGSSGVKFGSIYFYAPWLLTIPPDDASRHWQKLGEMFVAAGSVLEVAPANVQSQLSPLAMSFDCRKRRWAGCLFDIALRRLPGMPHTEPTYLQGQEPTRDRPQPGCWSATLKNVMASSVELIDWLIAAADVPKQEAEATSERPKPVERQAETLARGEGAGGGQPQLKPCEGKAWSQFQEAVGKNSELTTDRQAYDWFTDEIADDAGELPSFANWSRYLRAARKAMNQGKNGPRIGNETRSVVSAKRIEQPQKRIEADRR